MTSVPNPSSSPWPDPPPSSSPEASKNAAYYEHIVEQLSPNSKIQQNQLECKQIEKQIYGLVSKFNIGKNCTRDIYGQDQCQQGYTGKGVRVFGQGRDIVIDYQDQQDRRTLLKEENDQLRQQCAWLRQQLGKFCDMSKLSSIDQNRQTRLPAQIIQSLETYQKSLPQIQQQYRQRLKTLQKQNATLILKIEQLQKSIQQNLRSTSQLQTLKQKNLSLQAFVTQKQSEVAYLQTQLRKQAQQSMINLLQIPVQIIRQRDWQNTTKSIPEVRVQVRQIPVYIQKQLIRQVPIPLYINCTRHNETHDRQAQQKQIQQIEKLSSHSQPIPKQPQQQIKTENIQAVPEKNKKIKKIQSFDYVQNADVCLLQVPVQCRITDDTQKQTTGKQANIEKEIVYCLIQIPTQLEVIRSQVRQYPVTAQSLQIQRQMQRQLQYRLKHQLQKQRSIQSQLKSTILSLKATHNTQMAQKAQTIQTLQQAVLNLQFKLQSQLQQQPQIQLLQHPLVLELPSPPTIIQKQIQKYNIIQIPIELHHTDIQYRLFEHPVPLACFGVCQMDNKETQTQNMHMQMQAQGLYSHINSQHYQDNEHQTQSNNSKSLIQSLNVLRSSTNIAQTNPLPQVNINNNIIGQLDENQSIQQQQQVQLFQVPVHIVEEKIVVVQKEVHNLIQLPIQIPINVQPIVHFIQVPVEIAIQTERQDGQFKQMEDMLYKQMEQKLVFKQQTIKELQRIIAQLTYSQQPQPHPEPTPQSLSEQLQLLKQLLFQKSQQLLSSTEHTKYLQQKLSYIQKQLLPSQSQPQAQPPSPVTPTSSPQYKQVVIATLQQQLQNLRSEQYRQRRIADQLKDEIQNVRKIKDQYIHRLEHKIQSIETETRVHVWEIPLEVVVQVEVEKVREVVHLVQIPVQVVDRQVIVQLFQVPTNVQHQPQQQIKYNDTQIEQLKQNIAQKQQIIDNLQLQLTSMDSSQPIIHLFQHPLLIPLEPELQLEQTHLKLQRQLELSTRDEQIQNLNNVIDSMKIQYDRLVAMLEREQNEKMEVGYRMKDMENGGLRLLEMPVELVGETVVQLYQLPVHINIQQQQQQHNKQIAEAQQQIILLQIPTEIPIPQPQIHLLQHPIAMQIPQKHNETSTQNTIHLLQIPVQQLIFMQKQEADKQISVDKQKQKQIYLLELPIENIVTVVQEVQKVKEVIKVQYKEVPVDRIVQREIVREVPIVNEVIKEVKVQVEKQVIKQVPVQIYIVKQVPKQVIVQKQVPKQVQIIKQQIKQVPVQIIRQVLLPVQILIPVTVQAIKQIPIQVPVPVQVPVQVQKIRQIIKQIEVIKQVPTIVEKEVIREIVKEIPVQVQVQVIKEVQVPVRVEVQVIKEVPVVVEKEVIRQIIKQIPVQLEVPVQKRVEVIKQVQVIKQIIKQVPIQLTLQPTIPNLLPIISSFSVEKPQNTDQQQQLSQFVTILQDKLQELKAIRARATRASDNYYDQEEEEAGMQIQVQIKNKNIKAYLGVDWECQTQGLGFVQIKQVYVDRPFQVIREIVREIEKPVQVEKIVEVVKQVPIEIEVVRVEYVQKPVQIQKIVQKIVQRPVQIQKQVIKQITVQKQVKVQIPIQTIKYIEKPIQTIKYVQKQIPIQIQKQVIKYVDRPVEIEVIKYVDKPVQVQVQTIRYVDRLVEKIVEKPVEKIVERQIVRQKPVQVIKYVEKIRPVQVIKYVQKPVQVIKQVIVQVPVQVVKYITKSETKFQSPKRQSIDNKATIQQNPHSKSSSQSNIKIPNLEIPSDFNTHTHTRTLSNPSSSRSSHSNEQQRQSYHQRMHLHGSNFGNSNSGFGFEPARVHPQRQREQELAEKYQEKIKQLSEEKDYMMEQMEIMGATVSKQLDQIQLYRQNLFKMNESYQQLRKQIQQRSFSKNRSVQLQSKLKSQLQSKSSLQSSIKTLELELQTVSSRYKKSQMELELARQQKSNLLNELSQLESYLASLEKTLEEKNYCIADLQQNIKYMKEFVQDVEEKQRKGMERRTMLEEEIGQLRNLLEERQRERDGDRDGEQIRLGVEDVRKIKEIMEENERNYKIQVDGLKVRYQQVLTSYKKQIDSLNAQIERLAYQKQQQSSNSQPTKIQDSSLIKSLQQQNTNLRKVVQILHSQISYMKKKSQPADPLLKSITFSNINPNPSNPTNYSDEGSPLPTNKKRNSAFSKIRIEDIQEDSDVDAIEELTQLVRVYGEQIEQKDKQIGQLNRVIASYEQTFDKMEIQSRSGSSSQIKDRRSQLDKQSLDMNVYVSKILRKLSIAQQSLTRQRNEKTRYTMRIKQLQKQIQALSLNAPNSSFEQSQLLEQVVFQLQNQKNKNEHLLSQILMLRQEINRGHDPTRGRQRERERESYGFQFDDMDDQIPLELLDNQTLLRQVKVYKAEYYRVLKINREMQAQIKILQERVKMQSHCSSHIDTITYLSRKVDQYENLLIPRLKQEIKKCRDSYAQVAFRDLPDISENYLKGQQSPNFTRRQDTQKPPSRSIPSAIQKPQKRKSNPEPQPQPQTKDYNLHDLIHTKMPLSCKYTLACKLLQFSKSLLGPQLQSLCPQRLHVLYFNPDQPQLMKIVKSQSKSKTKDKIKFYQAPEVLVGQSQSERSLVWTLGVIIDEIFVGKGYYQKFAEILGPKNNYQYRGAETEGIGKILEKMIVKDKGHRIGLADAYEEMAHLAI